MTERLSPLDASFLHVETPSAHMHVGWKGRFAPGPGRPPITLERVRAQVAARLSLAPRFRQRLAFLPGNFGPPAWVDDERFDIRAHVLALGHEEEVVPRKRFDALADLVLSTPLDRGRALWEVHVAPRLEDGTAGVVMKAHHAMVDGLSAVALAMLLLDVEPDAPEPPPLVGAWRPQSGPSPVRLTVDALADAGRQPLRAAGRLARDAGNPARLAHTLRRAALSVGEDVLRPAPASRFNVPIGPRRTLVGHAMPIDRALSIKRSRGVPLNDVVLAIVAGALRQLALGRGTTPAPLKVMVPVARRGADAAGDLGNRIAFVSVTLPLHLRRPSHRLTAINAQTREFKTSGRAEGGEAVLGAVGMLPAPLQARAARLAASPRAYNLVVSNVPGPRVPVYLLGARGVEAFPVIPLSDGHALSIGVCSLHDKLCFGGYADPGALPEVRDLPGALAAATLELDRGSSGPRRRAA